MEGNAMNKRILKFILFPFLALTICFGAQAQSNQITAYWDFTNMIGPAAPTVSSALLEPLPPFPIINRQYIFPTTNAINPQFWPSITNGSYTTNLYPGVQYRFSIFGPFGSLVVTDAPPITLLTNTNGPFNMSDYDLNTFTGYTNYPSIVVLGVGAGTNITIQTNFVGGGTVLTINGNAGGGGSQTPWAQNINGNGFSLYGVLGLTNTGPVKFSGITGGSGYFAALDSSGNVTAAIPSGGGGGITVAAGTNMVATTNGSNVVTLSVGAGVLTNNEVGAVTLLGALTAPSYGGGGGTTISNAIANSLTNAFLIDPAVAAYTNSIGLQDTSLTYRLNRWIQAVKAIPQANGSGTIYTNLIDMVLLRTNWQSSPSSMVTLFGAKVTNNNATFTPQGVFFNGTSAYLEFPCSLPASNTVTCSYQILTYPEQTDGVLWMAFKNADTTRYTYAEELEANPINDTGIDFSLFSVGNWRTLYIDGIPNEPWMYAPNINTQGIFDATRNSATVALNGVSSGYTISGGAPYSITNFTYTNSPLALDTVAIGDNPMPAGGGGGTGPAWYQGWMQNWQAFNIELNTNQNKLLEIANRWLDWEPGEIIFTGDSRVTDHFAYAPDTSYPALIAQSAYATGKIVRRLGWPSYAPYGPPAYGVNTNLPDAISPLINLEAAPNLEFFYQFGINAVGSYYSVELGGWITNDLAYQSSTGGKVTYFLDSYNTNSLGVMTSNLLYLNGFLLSNTASVNRFIPLHEVVGDVSAAYVNANYGNELHYSQQGCTNILNYLLAPSTYVLSNTPLINFYNTQTNTNNGTFYCPQVVQTTNGCLIASSAFFNQGLSIQDSFPYNQNGPYSSHLGGIGVDLGIGNTNGGAMAIVGTNDGSGWFFSVGTDNNQSPASEYFVISFQALGVGQSQNLLVAYPYYNNNGGVNVNMYASWGAGTNDFIGPVTFRSNVYTGTNVISGNGSGLTNINASALASGTVPYAVLPTNYPTFQTTNGNLTVSNGNFTSINERTSNSGTDAVQLTYGANLVWQIGGLSNNLQFADEISGNNALNIAAVTDAATFAGVISGNGSGLTNIQSSNIVTKTAWATNGFTANASTNVYFLWGTNMMITNPASPPLGTVLTYIMKNANGSAIITNSGPTVSNTVPGLGQTNAVYLYGSTTPTNGCTLIYDGTQW
jgi:hypothetical protein